jgi:hypothetical protein
VRVPVVDVREVRVCMSNRRVLMGMRVRLITIPLKVVGVLMVFVVPVPMVMVQDLVSVRMFMPFTDMKLDSQSHARRGQALVLVMDAARMRADGYAFSRSDNGVWLTEVVPAA